MASRAEGRLAIPGIYEYCMSGQHAECHQPDCRCPCHQHVQKMMRENPTQASSIFPNSNINIQCIKCKFVAYSDKDKFCRACGASLKGVPCDKCKEIVGMGDKFCWSCGAALMVNTGGAGGMEPVREFTAEDASALEELNKVLEAKARVRPSDVEAPVQEVR